MSKDMTAKQEWQNEAGTDKGRVVKSSSLRICLFIIGTAWSVATSALTGIEVPLGWCTTSSGTRNNWRPYYGSYDTQGWLIAEPTQEARSSASSSGSATFPRE